MPYHSTIGYVLSIAMDARASKAACPTDASLLSSGMTCTGLWYAERDIVGRALSVTTMAVTFLYVRYNAILQA